MIFCLYSKKDCHYHRQEPEAALLCDGSCSTQLVNDSMIKTLNLISFLDYCPLNSFSLPHTKPGNQDIL